MFLFLNISCSSSHLSIISRVSSVVLSTLVGPVMANVLLGLCFTLCDIWILMSCSLSLCFFLACSLGTLPLPLDGGDGFSDCLYGGGGFIVWLFWWWFPFVFPMSVFFDGYFLFEVVVDVVSDDFPAWGCCDNVAVFWNCLVGGSSLPLLWLLWWWWWWWYGGGGGLSLPWCLFVVFVPWSIWLS